MIELIKIFLPLLCCLCYVELYQIEVVFWTFVVCILFKYIMLHYVMLDYLECCWII